MTEEERSTAYRLQQSTRALFQKTQFFARAGSNTARLALFNKTLPLIPPYEIPIGEMDVEYEDEYTQTP